MTTSMRFLHWAPRILCLAAIAFISLFSLDAFGTGESVWKQIAGFLMHMIPSFVLIIVLLLAWRYEKWGGILFILIGLITTPLVFNHNYAMNNSIGMSLLIISMITLPFVLIGILFLANHYKKQKSKSV